MGEYVFILGSEESISKDVPYSGVGDRDGVSKDSRKYLSPASQSQE